MTDMISRVPKPEQLIETYEIVNLTMGELIAKAGNFPPIMVHLATSVLVDPKLITATAWECITQDVEPDIGAVAILAHKCLSLHNTHRKMGFFQKIVQNKDDKKQMEIAEKLLIVINPILKSNFNNYHHDEFVSSVFSRYKKSL